MHLDDAALAAVRGQLGEPQPLRWQGEVTAEELALARWNPARRHDVTFFVFNGPRLALIRKPGYPPQIWRPPGGGVRPGETVVDGIRREALEELGAPVAPTAYLVDAAARFEHEGDALEWRTHVFAATTDAEALAPRDTREIAAARWGTLDELAGPLREGMLATGRALWRYRVALHDATAQALASRRP